MENSKITIEDRFEEELKHQQGKSNKASIKRVHKILAVILLVIGVCVYSVEEWRVQVSNFFRETTDEYTEIKFTEAPVSSYSVNGITLNYIPDGYRLVGDYSKIGEYTSLEFQDEVGNIIHFDASKVTPNQNVTIDTEEAIVTEFEYRGCTAIKSIKNRIQILMWYNNEDNYILKCKIGEEELMKIADNIDF